MKKSLLVVAGFALAFLTGYLPSSVRAGRLSDELEQSSIRYQSQVLELEEENRILKLQRDLGTLLLEVEDRNYGLARDSSTNWFDQLAEAISLSSKEATRRALGAISGRRDVLTALLTEANTDAAIQIRGMYGALADVTRAD